MKYFLNKANTQFDILLGGSVEQVIRTMVYHDESEATILVASTGQYHAYTWSVIQHATTAS